MGVEYEHFLLPEPNSFYPEIRKVKKLLDAMTAGKWLPAPGENQAPLFRFIKTEQEKSPQKIHSTKVKYSILERVLHFLFDKVFFRDKKSMDLGPLPSVRPAPWPLNEEWLAKLVEKGFFLEFEVNHLAESGLRYPLNRLDHPADETYYKVYVRLCFDYIHTWNETIDELQNTFCQCGEDLEFKPKDDVFFYSRLHAVCPACGESFDPSDVPAAVTDGWTGESRSFNGGAASRFSISIDCGKCIPHDGNIGFEKELIQLCESVLGCRFKQVGGIH